MRGEGEGRRRGSGPGRPDGMRGEGEERRNGSGRGRAGQLGAKVGGAEVCLEGGGAEVCLERGRAEVFSAN